MRRGWTSVTERPPISEPRRAEFDVGAAIDQLFQEIISRSENPLLQTSLNLLREETLAIRAYEAEMLPGREAEYQRLLDCWRRRDKRGLQRELDAYYQRREDLAARVARRMMS
jgi:DNA-binding FadR family transcriptional regulator